MKKYCPGLGPGLGREKSTVLIWSVAEPMSLNHQSPVPLYQQLAERIRAEIRAGVYPPGSRIPAEHDLAGRYGVGRPTVRQATGLLVREGHLQRRRGAGTFVQAANRPLDLLSLGGTTAAFSVSGLDASLTLLEHPRLLTAGDCPGWPEGEPAYRIRRLATLEDQPVMYETIWLDASLFVGIEQQLHDGDSLSRIVRENYFLEISSADQSFSIKTVDSDIAARLGAGSAQPLLVVDRALHFGELRDVVHSEIICRADNWQFSQTLFPGAGRTPEVGTPGQTPEGRSPEPPSDPLPDRKPGQASGET